jgi:hypothetical protein
VKSNDVADVGTVKTFYVKARKTDFPVKEYFPISSSFTVRVSREMLNEPEILMQLDQTIANPLIKKSFSNKIQSKIEELAVDGLIRN